MQHTSFYWKSQKGFLLVRETSQFPQKLESWRKGSPAADTRELVSECKAFRKGFRRQPAIKTGKYSTQWITLKYQYAKVITGIAPSFQCIITGPEYNETSHFIWCKKIFSYYRGLQHCSTSDYNGWSDLLFCIFPYIKLKLFWEHLGMGICRPLEILHLPV